MQVGERIGGIFHLHEVKPTVLLGTMACLLTGPRRGWITAGVLISSGELAFTTDAGSYQLDMSRDVALRLASLLHVLVAQSRIALGEVELVDKLADEGVRARVDARRVICAWPMAATRAVHELVGDEVNLHLHPVVADKLATAIVRGLAEFAPR
jgi:hypothetical protein